MRWKIRKEKLWHWLFLAAVFFKGLDGTLELLGGLVLLFLSNTFLMNHVEFLFHHEFAEKPTDPIIQYLLNVIHISENTQLFAGAYLLGHGIVKVTIAGGLLLKKIWVFPVAEIILIVFITYQIYRFTHTNSPLLLFLTILDTAVIFLIYKEYKRIKRMKL